ncbi:MULTISPECIES: ferredoxin [Mycobacteriaceae]|uniref:ferredoxin n=1 Tax=Mycobacteriaceae TaxID=1762 RepID=UPI000B813DAB|nr:MULTISPECIES: ferredoxin [Mycobacteriaceae]MCV7253269.1 ferredoxin [Mycobacterium hackensackense]
MRVTVDDEACAGHGICVGLCPEVFTLTGTGYAEAIRTEVPTRVEDAVAEAVSQCPEHAIHTTS